MRGEIDAHRPPRQGLGCNEGARTLRRGGRGQLSGDAVVPRRVVCGYISAVNVTAVNGMGNPEATERATKNVGVRGGGADLSGWLYQ